MLASLERDCADLNQEISTLECLLENVDLWWKHLGKWQAQVLSDVVRCRRVQQESWDDVWLLQIGDERCSLAVMIQNSNGEQDQVGWVVTRTVHAWQHFYFRLREVCRFLTMGKRIAWFVFP